MSQMKDLPRPERRPRRLRRNPVIRSLVRETRLTPGQLVLPLFIIGAVTDLLGIASVLLLVAGGVLAMALASALVDRLQPLEAHGPPPEGVSSSVDTPRGLG